MGLRVRMTRGAWLPAIAFALLVGLLPSRVAAAGPSYLYSHTNHGIVDVSAPDAYLPGEIRTGRSLGVELVQPEDLIVDRTGNFYLCDAGVGRIYQFDPQFHLIRTIDGFEAPSAPGGRDTFRNPQGICVDMENRLYIADTGNGRVVVLDDAGRLVRILKDPQKDTDVFDDTFRFVPRKLLVDSSNRLFVLCRNVFDGILLFSDAGVFIGFVGSNRVVPSAIDLIWKKVMSEEQKGKLVSFVPVEYTNIALDDQGFIYAVTSVRNVDNPIRRLNPSGNDILVRRPIDGSREVAGDILYVATSVQSEVVTGPSSFIDITSDEFGNYYALDSRRGRTFAYDVDGNLLFVFGSMGTGQLGALESPSAILYSNGTLFVLDRALCQIIAFEPTEYALLIRSAMQAYVRQEYESNVDLWRQVIRENSHFDLAYVRAGYGLYRLKRYKEAMDSFRIANVKTGYSKAFEQYATEWLDRNFDAIALGIGLGSASLSLVLLAARRRRIRRKEGNKAS